MVLRIAILIIVVIGLVGLGDAVRADNYHWSERHYLECQNGSCECGWEGYHSYSPTQAYGKTWNPFVLCEWIQVKVYYTEGSTTTYVSDYVWGEEDVTETVSLQAPYTSYAGYTHHAAKEDNGSGGYYNGGFYHY